MLLLPRYAKSLTKDDLHEDELQLIEENAYGQLQFAHILRHGYTSIIAFQKRKNWKKPKIKEVERYIVNQDAKLVGDSVWFNRLAGWRTDFYDCDNLYDASEWYEKSNDGPNGYKFYNTYQFILWVRESHKYFDLKEKTISSCKWVEQKPSVFLRKYLANLPASEMFCKLGFTRLAMSSRFCKAKGKSKKDIMALLKKTSSNELADYTLNEIYGAARKGVSMEQYVRNMCEKKVANLLWEYQTPFTTSEVTDYLLKKAGIPEYDLKNNGYETKRYASYLANCRTLHFNFEDKGVVMPRNYEDARLNIQQRLNEAQDKQRAKAKRGLTRKIAKFADELGEELYEGGVSIKPLRTVSEFIEMGNYFHNCVGRCRYDEKMGERSSYIVIVYQDETPIECVEIATHTNRILQELGMYNRRTEQYPQLNPLVTQYAQTRTYRLN